MYVSIKNDINKIKDLADAYKGIYDFIFNIEIYKTDDFKKFMINSLSYINKVLNSNHIGEHNQIVESLIDKFDVRISGNHTGFSILKNIFYIVFCEAINDYMNLNNNDTYIKSVTSLTSLITIFDDYNNNLYEKWKRWYRGQSNFEWNLIPSLYRCLNGKKLVHIDNKYIFDLYKKFGLIDKMNRTIGYQYIDYDFESFMQHAVSLSPLLDFTTNPIVATVVALSDTTNFKGHYENDSSLYEITIRDEKVVYDKDIIDKALMNLNIYYCESVPFMQQLNLNGRTILIDCINSLISALTPSIMFIDIPSNDRMRYQSGKFVLFHECLILKDKVYVELSKHISFRIYKISKNLKAHISNKQNLLETIYSRHPEFTMSNLMNPYDYFSE